MSGRSASRQSILRSSAMLQFQATSRTRPAPSANSVSQSNVAQAGRPRYPRLGVCGVQGDMATATFSATIRGFRNPLLNLAFYLAVLIGTAFYVINSGAHYVY